MNPAQLQIKGDLNKILTLTAAVSRLESEIELLRNGIEANLDSDQDFMCEYGKVSYVKDVRYEFSDNYKTMEAQAKSMLKALKELEIENGIAKVKSDKSTLRITLAKQE